MEITPEVVEAFCTDFEGFADSSRWPTAQLVRALQTADRETGSNRWGGYSDHSIKQRGMFFFAAHHLTMSKAGARATTIGGAPSSVAQVQSKSVGDESISYALNSQNIPAGDEALSATLYGQEFMRLRRRIGRGGSSSNARGFL